MEAQKKEKDKHVKFQTFLNKLQNEGYKPSTYQKQEDNCFK